MRLTVIGSGDAFGSGGRHNTCFHLVAGERTVLIDCGASAPVGLRACNIDPNSIDAVILSHLHGDHFGGIPFLMLDGQFLSRRERPLLFAGPPGTADRINAAMEIFYPNSTKTKYRFPWSVTEIPVGKPTDILGLNVVSAEVMHFSGAPSTALRVSDGQKTFAYSGDTQWTEALLAVAAGADLFMIECYEYERELTGHMSWKTIKQRLADFAARRVMLTHMNHAMLARLEEAKAAGALVAEDGLVLDL
jgi:ribonuclease BN (tRNA processing enzyme)